MRKWILRNKQSPGDILMLTAAVRDLHHCLPGQFLTDVRTSCPQLWEYNPYLTPLAEDDPEVEIIDCHYPLIHQSNQSSVHFVQGFIDFLNERLPQRIAPSVFKGDIHLSAAEKCRPSPVAERIGQEIPYWVVVAGGKFDATVKWWPFRRYQAVVDQFREKILFVQIGEDGHFHPELHGVLDFRGKTSLRDLIRLVYHAQGVLCPVTFLMHLAAAVEVRAGPLTTRACVVVAGGREPPQWEAYPHHQFIHTIGALPCCAAGGCWRSRTLPLGDNDENDRPEALCLDVRDGMPHCMHLITPEEVARRIDLYFRGGFLPFLDPQEAAMAKPFCKPSLREILRLT
jgi:ADP-heptose:LPS heptosyltransferase